MAIPETRATVERATIRGSRLVMAWRTATLLWIASLVACGGLTVEEHGQVDRWLLCDECVDGELDAVVAFQGRAVGRLTLALIEGPTQGRIDMMTLKYRDSYRRIAARMGPNPRGVSEAQYINRHLANYQAVYQSRSAIALGRIGTPQAIATLRAALLQPGYRADVLDTIRESLGSQLAITGGNGQTALVATTLTDSIEIQVTDGNDVPVGNVPVSFAVQTGNGQLFGGTPRTDPVTGKAYVWWTLGHVPGQDTVQATAGEDTVNFQAAANVAAGNVITPSLGLAQRAPAGTAVGVAPIALVTDGSGNPAAAVTVTFAVVTGGGTLTGTVALSDANGLAAVGSWVLGPAVGAENRFVASIASATPSERDTAWFTATTTGPRADTLRVVAAGVQTGTPGDPVGVLPTVEARNLSGVALAGVPISFTLIAGGGTITGNIQTTDAAGRATVGSWVLGLDASVNRLRASALNVPGVTFTAITSVLVTASTSLPTSGVGLEVVRLTAEPGFSFDPAAIVTEAGPGGISFVNVAVDVGGAWIEYVPEGGSTGVPTISGVIPSGVTLSGPLTLPADEAVTVPLTTFAGTDNAATAPPITIPGSGNTLVYYDGGAFGGTFPAPGSARLYAFTLSSATTFNVRLTWQTNLIEDLGVYVRDVPMTFPCVADAFGGQAGGPEVATCNLGVGAFVLGVVTFGNPVDVLALEISTP
ncbi:MAG: hypothetical protein O7E49_15005 [Gemmatimonadetes bacterium]|nr:hypothetical protein [Gemmatimonadota bacterium]